jgi:amino acid transporter
MAGYEKTYEETADPSFQEPSRRPLGTRIIDSFKRDPNVRAAPKTTVEVGGKNFDVETAAAATAQSPLARKLKGRHLQMIAIGGSIGAL